jgi:hypothetical protein
MKWIRYEGHYDRAANKVRSRSVRAMSPPTSRPKNQCKQMNYRAEP